MNLLLKNATYIDWKTLSFTEADILVPQGNSGKIKLFYPGEANETEVEILDCSGKFVTKAFANGHHHVYSALARGMPTPPKTPQNFHEILQYVWWRLDKALDLEMIEASALFSQPWNVPKTESPLSSIIMHRHLLLKVRWIPLLKLSKR
ncbi:MAG: hypothetical protein R2759_19755 [Bacteroidales bacterium]